MNDLSQPGQGMRSTKSPHNPRFTLWVSVGQEAAHGMSEDPLFSMRKKQDE
jgi:hypothetical protein